MPLLFAAVNSSSPSSSRPGPGFGRSLGPRTITNFRDSFVVSKSKARVFEQTDNLQIRAVKIAMKVKVLG